MRYSRALKLDSKRIIIFGQKLEPQAIVFCLPKNIMNVFDISDESFGNFMNVYVTTLKVERVGFVNDNMYKAKKKLLITKIHSRSVKK